MKSIRLAVLLLIISSPCYSHAAFLFWNLPNTISGDSDVLNGGSTLYAYNFGDPSVPSTTVNGIKFDPYPVTGIQHSVDNGNVALLDDGGDFMKTFSNNGSAASPFADLSANYKTLLETNTFPGGTFSGKRIGVTLKNLTVGQQYTVQVWANRSLATTDSATLDFTIPFDPNTTDSEGGVGQTASGFFIANASTQQFQIIPPVGGATVFLNALQVQIGQIGPVNPPIFPEPGTLAFVGIAIPAALLLRRRRAGSPSRR